MKDRGNMQMGNERRSELDQSEYIGYEDPTP